MPISSGVGQMRNEKEKNVPDRFNPRLQNAEVEASLVCVGISNRRCFPTLVYHRLNGLCQFSETVFMHPYINWQNVMFMYTEISQLASILVRASVNSLRMT